MITVTLMKKTKKLENSSGNIKNMGGNIPGRNLAGRNSPGGNLIGGKFPGGSFPDTEENICQKFSSVHAFTSIFIRKAFILPTHSFHA